MRARHRSWLPMTVHANAGCSDSLPAAKAILLRAVQPCHPCEVLSPRRIPPPGARHRGAQSSTGNLCLATRDDGRADARSASDPNRQPHRRAVEPLARYRFRLGGAVPRGRRALLLTPRSRAPPRDRRPRRARSHAGPPRGRRRPRRRKRRVSPAGPRDHSSNSNPARARGYSRGSSRTTPVADTNDASGASPKRPSSGQVRQQRGGPRRCVCDNTPRRGRSLRGGTSTIACTYSTSSSAS